VITGFTSGIALIIAIGQIDNFLGVTTPKAENNLSKLLGYFTHPIAPDWHAVTLALIVMLVMIGLPRLTKAVPGSLVGLALATVAIARSSVGIKSGGMTRVMSFVHAGVLLLSVFALGPLIGRIPLAALAGVLMITAWRMNEWESIHFFTRTRLKHAIAGVLVTMVATVALDLTQAILIGIAISALIYIRQSAGSVGVTSE